jgi:hypothetical protein
MGHGCNSYIRTALDLARKLIILADEGDAVSSGDDGCSVLYGVIRDCAYKIRAQAEREKEAHRSQGTWDNHESGEN